MTAWGIGSNRNEIQIGGSGKSAAMSKKIQAPLGPLETEVKIMEEGMQFAWDMGIRSAIFVGDSQLVFHSLLGSATPPSSISNIISGSLLQA